MRAEPTWVDKVHDGDKEEQRYTHTYMHIHNVYIVCTSVIKN